MSRTLSLLNRQRVRRVDARLLRQITLHLLDAELGVESFELAIHLVGAEEMAKVNWDFLQHEGSTDVITFDHSESAGQVSSLSPMAQPVPILPNISTDLGARTGRDRLEACPTLNGELFICLNDAVKQAREFRTTWQGELARYVIHGLLHLCGHDDLSPGPRRVMKREENRLLKATAAGFKISRLARARKSSVISRKS